jgi:ABC-type sugar transport system permease subunit
MRRAERGAAGGGALSREARLAGLLVLPALGVVVLVALFPLAWTFWESLHLHDLRTPWRGRPFIGLTNYAEALGDARFLAALAHTVAFTACSVAIEMVLGLALALTLNHTFRWRGPARAAALLPWAIPTVVTALLWRFLFDDRAGVVNPALVRLGVAAGTFVWFTKPLAAWVPLVLADAWKTAPFVALLLLAGLQNIDGSLYEAARVDGAGPWRQFTGITLPLLRPALLVALVFRTLDAFRVFDLIYVLTGGGPGTATEPISLYTFNALLQNLRFGFGSALSVIVFAIVFSLALVYVRLLRVDLTEPAP